MGARALLNNSVNCWDTLKRGCHNVTWKGKRDGLKNSVIKMGNQQPSRQNAGRFDGYPERE